MQTQKEQERGGVWQAAADQAAVSRNGKFGMNLADNRPSTIVTQKNVQLKSVSSGVQDDGIIQRQRNKRRWTPQQRAQSEKFWKKKTAREERRQQGLTAYIAGLKDDYGIIVDESQARVLSEAGFSRSELNDLRNSASIPQIVGLSRSGFSRWAITNLNIQHLEQWNGNVPPADLVNEILALAHVGPWIEAQHQAERNLGDQRVAANRNKIGTKLGVSIQKQHGGAFVLSALDYESACAFLSVRQALRHPVDLDPDIVELVRYRIIKSKTEHGIQDGNQIFFKGAPGDSTVVHELVHFYGAQEKFIQNFCFGQADRINEGFTEFFARQAQKADKPRIRQIYPKEVAAVDFMIKHIGYSVLHNAYFSGNVSVLKQEYKSKIGADWTPQEEARIITYPTLKK